MGKRSRCDRCKTELPENHIGRCPNCGELSTAATLEAKAMGARYFCQSCGAQLPEDHHGPCPIPECGGLSRRIELTIHAEAKVSDSFTVHTGDLQAQDFSIRHSDFNGLSSATDARHDGATTSSIAGKPPQGESDVVQVCNALISHLNSRGGNWRADCKPSGPEEGVDCVTADGQSTMKMQVTRLLDQSTFKKLANRGQCSDEFSGQQMADQLSAAIESKANKFADQHRSSIVLVLDGRHAPHVLPKFLDKFCDDNSEAVRDLGFEAVWIVGPTSELIRRLDSLH